MVLLHFGIDVYSPWVQPSFRPGRPHVFAALHLEPALYPAGRGGAARRCPRCEPSSQCHQVDARHYGASRRLKFLIPLFYLKVLLNLTSRTCTSDSNTGLGEASHICLKYWANNVCYFFAPALLCSLRTYLPPTFRSSEADKMKRLEVYYRYRHSKIVLWLPDPRNGLHSVAVSLFIHKVIQHLCMYWCFSLAVSSIIKNWTTFSFVTCWKWLNIFWQNIFSVTYSFTTF